MEKTLELKLKSYTDFLLVVLILEFLTTSVFNNFYILTISDVLLWVSWI